VAREKKLKNADRAARHDASRCALDARQRVFECAPVVRGGFAPLIRWRAFLRVFAARV
jgi:putative component of membrane protein insertase Oxa1/YidC/SpoIIIJ protein YidD